VKPGESTSLPQLRVEKALAVCRNDTLPADVARQVVEGRRELDALAGALATHHKEEDWRVWLDAATAVIEHLADDDEEEPRRRGREY
jgi:hypothetical protein